jgi:tryptophan 7-halogenase
MPVESIVIAGGGLAGWLTAAALVRRVAVPIRVIEQPGPDDSLGLPLPIETTLPATSEVLAGLGFAEEALLAASNGCFSLGRALSGWGGDGPAFHPYGDIGAPIGPVAFQHLVARLRSAGEPIKLANYALAALAAQAGRFARPSSSGQSVLSTMGYGIQIETERLRLALRASAIASGVSAAQGAVARLKLDAHGLIAALLLDDGTAVSGDFFLDCSGQTASLIGRMPGAQFLDWSEWLPCSRAVTAFTADRNAPPPYLHLAADSQGWRSGSAVRGGFGEAIVYAGVGEPEPGAYPFSQGRQTAPWLGNCLAIGGAAGVLDPLASTQFHLAAKAIARLLSLFPGEPDCQTEAAEYNRQTAEEHDNARDFVIAHYKLNRRQGEPFWDQCRSMAVPDRLAHKIALYAGTGRTVLHDEESFEAADWIALFDAMGVQPKRYDVMADALPVAQISAHLARVREAMLRELGRIPTHADYLRTTKAGQR